MSRAMRALAAAAMTAGLVLVGSPAQASATCWMVKPTYLTGHRVVLRIGSNTPTNAKVHKFVVRTSTDFGPQERTLRNMPPNVTISTGGDRIVRISGWKNTGSGDRGCGVVNG
jgi:hypothetical protein